MKRLYFSIILTVLGSLFLIGWGLDKIAEKGFTIVENVLSNEECKNISDKLDVINEEEQKEVITKRQ